MAEIPEAMLDKTISAYVAKWGDVWRSTPKPFDQWPPEAQADQRECLRAALTAIGVGEMVEALGRARTGIELVEVDLTAGDMPAKTRVALALQRVRAILSVLTKAGG